jgi:hypothetical protein
VARPTEVSSTIALCCDQTGCWVEGNVARTCRDELVGRHVIGLADTIIVTRPHGASREGVNDDAAAQNSR